MSTTRKIKVLVVGENPLLHTGFSTYNKELLIRLSQRENLEVACLACSGAHNDPAFLDLPYRVYSAVPNGRRQEEVEKYSKTPLAEFGAFRFNEVCLDFKPDVVCAFRDHINDAWLETHPYRRFYKLIMMPTIDAAPRHFEEIATYARCDGLLTYGDFGRDTLREQIGNFDNLFFGSAPPAAEYDIFKPHLYRNSLKNTLGLKDKIIVGAVSRNQPRKILPELIEAFALLQKRAPDYIKDRLALYLHTGYPDHGWELPKLILNAGIASKTYFTYSCKSCKEASASTYRGVISHCPNCNNPDYTIANSSNGVSREILAGVYNCFDIYTQLATCEGWGMPACEAASCGISGITIDYSAMSEVGRTCGSRMIKPDALRLEAGLERKLACVSPESICEALMKEVLKPTPLREFEGARAARRVREAYSYDKNGDVWAKAIESVGLPSHRWDSSPQYFSDNLPEFSSDFEAIRYFSLAMTPESGILNSKYLARFLDMVTIGANVAKAQIWKDCLERISVYNIAEGERAGRTK